MEMSSETSAGFVTVLVVSPNPEDHRALANILTHSNWELESATTSCEAVELLRTKPHTVVICEYGLPDGSWRDVLTGAELLNVPCRIIVTSRGADDGMWAEVLNEGGYDCLAKPFHPEEVFRLVSLAWRSSKRASARSAERMPTTAAASVA